VRADHGRLLRSQSRSLCRGSNDRVEDPRRPVPGTYKAAYSLVTRTHGPPGWEYGQLPQGVGKNLVNCRLDPFYLLFQTRRRRVLSGAFCALAVPAMMNSPSTTAQTPIFPAKDATLILELFVIAYSLAMSCLASPI
jgi:hypothetical protein